MKMNRVWRVHVSYDSATAFSRVVVEYKWYKLKVDSSYL